MRECNHYKITVLSPHGTYEEFCRFCRKPWAEIQDDCEYCGGPMEKDGFCSKCGLRKGGLDAEPLEDE